MSTVGWYSTSGSGSGVDLNQDTASFDIGGWAGTYDVYTDMACIDSAAGSPTGYCTGTNFKFRGVESLTSGDDTTFYGILGLGQIVSSYELYSYVYQWGATNSISASN